VKVKKKKASNKGVRKEEEEVGSVRVVGCGVALKQEARPIVKLSQFSFPG
jgi:hypothetical protein